MNDLQRFQHHSSLEVHSRQARAIIAGHYPERSTATTKKSYPIYGLIAYGLSLTVIWQRIRADDPYAELTLIEVERRIRKAFELIQNRMRSIDQKLMETLPGIQVDLYQSRQPLIISLNDSAFATTHAKLGARLVGLFDLLIRKLVTGKQFGIINLANFERSQYHATKVVRGVFAAPAEYRNRGVNRADIQEKTEKGIAATEADGPLPLGIMNRERHSEFGPKPTPHRDEPQ